MTARTHYEVLGVQPDAPVEVIEAAYRALAKRYHPDLRGPHASIEMFARVTKAYDVLRDPKQRRAHDEEIAAAARATNTDPDPSPSEDAEPIRPEAVAMDQMVRSALPALRPIGDALLSLLRSTRDIHIGPTGRHRLRTSSRHDGSDNGETFATVSRVLKNLPLHAPSTRLDDTPGATTARLTLQCPPGASIDASASLTHNATGTYLEYRLREHVWRAPLGVAIVVGGFFWAVTHWWFLSAVVALYVFLPLRWWLRRQRALILDSVANHLAPFQEQIFLALSEHAVAWSSIYRQMAELPTRRGVEVDTMRFGGGPPVVEQTPGISFEFKATQTACDIVAGCVAGLIWNSSPGWTTIGKASSRVGPGEAKLRVVMPLPEAAETIVDIHFVARLDKVTATQNAYAFTPPGSSALWISLTLPSVVAVLLWPRFPEANAAIAGLGVLATLLLLGGAWSHFNSTSRPLTAGDKRRHSAAVYRVQEALMHASSRLQTLTSDGLDIADAVTLGRPPLFLRVLRGLGAFAAAVFTWQVFVGLGTELLRQQGAQTGLGAIIVLCLIVPACGGILFLALLSAFWHSSREAPQTRSMVYAALAISPLLLVGPVGTSFGRAMSRTVASPPLVQPVPNGSPSLQLETVRRALSKTQAALTDLDHATAQLEEEYRQAVGHSLADAKDGRFPIGFAAALTRRDSLRQALADVLNAWTNARQILTSKTEAAQIATRLATGATADTDEVRLADLSSNAHDAIADVKRAQQHVATMKGVFALESLITDHSDKEQP